MKKPETEKEPPKETKLNFNFGKKEEAKETPKEIPKEAPKISAADIFGARPTKQAVQPV